MVIIKAYCKLKENGDYKMFKEEINKCTEKLINKGWEDIIYEGGVVSPDKSTLFIYNRSPYNGQLIQYKANVENKYNEICNSFIKRGDFCKI